MLVRINFNFVRAVAVLLFLASVSQAEAMMMRFDLPSQPLATTLLALGSQARTNILFDPPLVEGRNAPALKADMTLDQALARLLAGSGLKYRFLDDKSVIIVGPIACRCDALPHVPILSVVNEFALADSKAPPGA